MKLSEARLQLFQSDKMASLGRLAAGVAHEINNPLTGVLTYGSFLLKRAQNYPEMQEDLKVVVRETMRCREIVKSLLDFARQSIPKKSASDMNEIIGRAVAVVEHQVSIKGVKIVKSLEPQLPKVTVDPNQMQQVFVNLIVNASDAIESGGGIVTVSTKLSRLLPQGGAQIKSACCPNGHSLTTNDFKIEGLPAVRVKVRSGGEEGFMMLDPVYGRNRNHYELDVKGQSGLEALCPECGISLLKENVRCELCGGRLLSFVVPSQGEFETCVNKACGWQRWVAVDSAGQQEYVELSVSDTGTGISKEDLAKIFEPFFTTKGQKGTGLGLAVIWGIIDNHDGTISVESEPGRGTTFRIRLPLHHQAAR
jgi:two-component system NtrC family sensor kinase